MACNCNSQRMKADNTQVPEATPEPEEPIQDHLPAKSKPKRRRHPDAPAIQTAPFRRLAREITHSIKTDMKWEGKALEALQVGVEGYLLDQFHKADRVRKICKAETLSQDHWTHTLEG